LLRLIPAHEELGPHDPAVADRVDRCELLTDVGSALRAARFEPDGGQHPPLAEVTQLSDREVVNPVASEDGVPPFELRADGITALELSCLRPVLGWDADPILRPQAPGLIALARAEQLEHPADKRNVLVAHALLIPPRCRSGQPAFVVRLNAAERDAARPRRKRMKFMVSLITD